MFCLTFVVILFDSLIFLLRYADQRNFVMYIIMPKNYNSTIFKGLFGVLYLGLHWYILNLFLGHLLWSATVRVSVTTFSIFFFVF